ncbi:hypothetical protein [Secundilactobacillus collinoides]|uniref:hypothetical protein n=1 Tax=Secundilactobacillus collinoides TaxID=33960 RepID=UPI0006D12C6C|nr:hypothetical protein [Secundilactobacillus collinoides]
MAKTGKLLGIMAVFGALIGGGAASTSIQAQAQTLPAMKISKLNYQSTSKNLSFTAKTSADVSKIAVEYKGKTTYFKAKKSWHVSHLQIHWLPQFQGVRHNQQKKSAPPKPQRSRTNNTAR